MKHTDNCGRSGRKDVPMANCKMDCSCQCHRPSPSLDEINRAKLEAAEKVAKALESVFWSVHKGRVSLENNEQLLFVKQALGAWEKAGRGEI